jgi:hypothetical protein
MLTLYYQQCYLLGCHIREDDILHSHCHENLKSYIALTGWALWWRHDVSPVRYELGFYILQNSILHNHHRGNLKSYFTTILTATLECCQTYIFIEECHHLGHKNPVRTSQETHYISATESSQLMLCKIWGFHGGDYEVRRLLRCYAMWLLPTFRRNVLTPSSGLTTIGELWNVGGITSQKTAFFIVTMVKNSNLTYKFIIKNRTKGLMF